MPSKTIYGDSDQPTSSNARFRDRTRRGVTITPPARSRPGVGGRRGEGTTIVDGSRGELSTRLQPGIDAVTGRQAKLDQVREELETWRGIAVATDYEAVEECSA